MAQMNPTPGERAIWLAAGMSLSRKLDFAAVGVRALALEAGLPEESLKRNFVDLKHYMIALQQHFMDELRAAVLNATASHTPGYERLRSGAVAYLDGWLARPGLRGIALGVHEPAAQVAEGLRLQNQSFSLVLSTEFHAMGWPHAVVAARLFVAILQEVARAEHVQGRPNPAMREEIWEFLRSY
ncbi:MAG: hypothetical protein E6R07_09670 [Nevskiaceae bacterium]|nr:MAG: hypothetical protein E6R07_09670 [Nevskiaceae bacterium]